MKFGRNNQSPVDDQIAEADIADRLRMANALRDKSMAGAQLENVGGHLIGNPYARALTGVVQGFEGGQQREKAYGMATDLATSKRDRLTRALSGAGKDMTPDDAIAFGTQLMANPDTAEIGQFYMLNAQKAKERAASTQDLHDRWTRTDKVAADNFTRSQEGANTRSQNAIDAANARAANALSAKGAAGGGADPYSTIINSAKYGQLPFNTRTQEVTLPGIGPVHLKDLPAVEAANPDLQKYLVKPSDDPTTQHNVAEADRMGKADADYWASRPKAKAGRESLITDLKALRDSPGFASIFGAVGGRVPDLLPAARDARAQLAKVVGGMSLSNANLLVGQGSVSNIERDLLASAATILQDTSISDETAAAEVTKILDDLQTGKYAPGSPSGAMAPPEYGAAPPAGAPAAPDHSQLTDEQLKQQLGIP